MGKNIRQWDLILPQIEFVYKIKLPNTYEVSTTLNIADLSPYHGKPSSSDSRMSLFQPGEIETGVSICMTHNQDAIRFQILTLIC